MILGNVSMPRTFLLYTLIDITDTFGEKNADLNVCNFIHHQFEYGNCQLPLSLTGVFNFK